MQILLCPLISMGSHKNGRGSSAAASGGGPTDALYILYISHSICRTANLMGLQEGLAPSLKSEAYLMGSMRMVMRSDGSSMCSVLRVTLMVPPSSTAATSVSRGPTFARPYLCA